MKNIAIAVSAGITLFVMGAATSSMLAFEEHRPADLWYKYDRRNYDPKVDERGVAAGYLSARHVAPNSATGVLMAAPGECRSIILADHQITLCSPPAP